MRHKLFTALLLLGLTACCLSVRAQRYTMEFKQEKIEKVMAEVTKRTKYEFVYQKSTIKDAPRVTGQYVDTELNDILNDIFVKQCHLEYYVMKKSIVLSKKDESGMAVVTDAPVMYGVEDDDNMLEEVFVTGYQSVKRENATGAYQRISSKALSKRYTGDVLTNLEGRVPGLVQYNNGMNDGGESALTIRGAGSFNAKTNPLVVVDGLPIEGGLESVNPYNVESINVLKDAAAASIYGARASNGVIVITTKRGQSDKLQIDFNADLSISEKNDYSCMKWADASQLIELEKYNFVYVKNYPNKAAFNDLKSTYQRRRYSLSPIVRLLMAQYQGEISLDQMNEQFDRLSRNDYRREWQDLMERPSVTQQYNLALRNRGKFLNSNLVVNFKGDNLGRTKEEDNTLTLSYRGDANVTPWLNMEVGLNLISGRRKTHIVDEFNDITSFAPYMSMHNADGTLADMEAGAYLDLPSLGDTGLGLKSEAYNLAREVNMNFARHRETNIRSYIHANANILPEWRVGAHFQYEDIYSKANNYYEKESYYIRHLYNLYTSTDGTHYMPDGGMLSTSTAEGAYYTFRAQTDFSKTWAEKHSVEALAGFEYRQTHYTSANSVLLGYDERSQTNNMGLANFGIYNDLEGATSALGTDYPMYGAPSGNDFTSSDVLHRFYSLYFNGSYLYDGRYGASLSYRVDKTDLFGADPKFRGRPLWSVGACWNMEKEPWLEDVHGLGALKLRASYGLTGNIDQSVSSYLTATINVNEMNGMRVASLNTPPNEQLRWEKTASLNIGADFSLLYGRINGSIDYYRKNGSDLLTTTDVDPSTGWTSLTINNGKALNTGVELQLNGDILPAPARKKIGVSASLSLAYNKNEVTSVNHEATSGAEALASHTLHKGYPIHSLFSYRFAGMKQVAGLSAFGWYDKDGNVHTADINTEEFTADDIVYSGSLDPKVVLSFSPEVKWQGFTLSALFAYYGGHVMRARGEDWMSEGGQYGYHNFSEIQAVPSSYLNYWTSASDGYVPNGYPGGINIIGNGTYADANVVKADYMKLRSLMLSYDFPRKWCRHLSMESLTLRVQVNNLLTWTRNSLGIDPEANNPVSGNTMLKTPRSYTMSVNVVF